VGKRLAGRIGSVTRRPVFRPVSVTVLRSLAWLLAFSFFIFLFLPLPSPEASQGTPEALIEKAYEAAYSLDYPEALALAQRAATMTPESSVAQRAVAGVLWLQITFNRGAVSVDSYLGGLTNGKLALPKPSAELDAQFKAALGRAITLAENAIKRNPEDVGAQYDMSRAYALQASYSASAEESGMGAFKSAMRAYDAGEAILERAPTHPGATFVVGTYRYIVSALSPPTRVLAYIVGFGGGKERGISMVEAAGRDPGLRVDSQLALFMIFTREGRHADAVRMVHGLSTMYPRNRLFVLEEGAASIRAGKAPEADAILTRGLAAFDADQRPKVPGERGMWLYKRGMARVIQRRLKDAQDDLVAALAANPVGWIRGRVHIEIGKLHDLHDRRDQAVADYKMAKSICEANDDPVCINSANRYLDKPYGSPR
jgi:tetratricopeptide (TPR) repeat protein